MTNEDLDRIEQHLELSLPQNYRKMILSFPIPVSKGRAEPPLWDVANDVISANDEYRRGYGGAPAWPAHYFFIGDDGTACPFLLDLSQTPATLLQLDHGNPGAVLNRWTNIEIWMAEYLEEIGDLAFNRPTRLGLRQAVIRYAVGIIILIIVLVVIQLLQKSK
jgi:hypothetical protein